MKLNTITLTLLAFLATSAIQAQSLTPATTTGSKEVVKPSEEEQSRQQLEQQRLERTNASSAQLAKELGLDEKQTLRLKELDEKYARMLNEVRASTTDRNVIMEKDQSMRAEHDAELQQILTPEQYRQMVSSKQ